MFLVLPETNNQTNLKTLLDQIPTIMNQLHSNILVWFRLELPGIPGNYMILYDSPGNIPVSCLNWVRTSSQLGR